jgi:hypothetical protein
MRAPPERARPNGEPPPPLIDFRRCARGRAGRPSSSDCGGFGQPSCDTVDSDRKSADITREIVGGGLIFLGGALLFAGAMTHTVYVPDPPRPRAQILPWVAHGGGGVGMTLTF